MPSAVPSKGMHNDLFNVQRHAHAWWRFVSADRLDTINPPMRLHYHEAPAADTSIATGCWAKKRGGRTLRAKSHSSLKAVEATTRLPLPRGYFLPNGTV